MAQTHSYLEYHNALQHMVELPVAQLMTQHCQHLLCAAPCLFLLAFQWLLFLSDLLIKWSVVLQQCVVKHNTLVLEEAIEVGIAVCRALGALHHIELGEREVNLLGQLFNFGTEVTFREWCVLVKEWGNTAWIDGHEEKHNSCGEAPKVHKEVVSASLWGRRNNRRLQ